MTFRWNMAGPLILASASPRRRELLTEMGMEFRTETADVEELDGKSELRAEEIACLNAERKARAVARKHPEALVIGADTVVTCDGKIFGKPTDEADAEKMLHALSGRQHQVITGVSLQAKASGYENTFAEISQVTFKQLSDEAIRQYLGLVHVLDKAGAYAIQEHSELILDHRERSLTNVIGLPTERLGEELRKLNGKN